jgi:hypothetical protein
MTLPSLPKWVWFVVFVVMLLIVLALLKVDFQIGSGGVHLQQHLINK